MIDRERGFVRETIDRYFVDPEARGLRELREEIDAILSRDIPEQAKENAFLLRTEDRDGFPDWRLVWDRDETDDEMAERIAGEVDRAWTELGRIVRELQDEEFPRHHKGRPYGLIDAFRLDTELTEGMLIKIARKVAGT